MQIKVRHFLTCAATAAVMLMPLAASAYSYGYGEGYYYGYGEGYYYGYGEGYYYGYGYGQGTYPIKVTTDSFATGNFTVTGNISKGSGTFAIDDPLDPANKILYHSFVESPDVKDLYDGIVTLDAKGEATVQLPTYFDALNKDVRYQLKPVGASMPKLYVKSEEHDNQFGIGGGVPRGEVSWQVTGIRHDAYILANPIIPEVAKGEGQLVNKGEYLFPGYEQSFVPFANLFSGFGNFFGHLFGK